jgi:SAM-dependent methyltransferase
LTDNHPIMEISLLTPFASPSSHERISRIIRERSTNPLDMREEALRGLDLSFVHRVLDLGCGFGFMSEAISPRVAADATLVGMDLHESNRDPFLARVRASGREAAFVGARIGKELPFPNSHFDLIVSSFSLYYFPEAIPDIARLLRPAGLLLAITHSEKSFLEMFEAAGVPIAGSPLPSLLSQFSSENGEKILAPYFKTIEKIPYKNTLRFLPEHTQGFLEYVRFKLPCLLHEPSDDSAAALLRTAEEAIRSRSEILVEKDDAIFRCRGPQWRR